MLNLQAFLGTLFRKSFLQHKHVFGVDTNMYEFPRRARNNLGMHLEFCFEHRTGPKRPMAENQQAESFAAYPLNSAQFKGIGIKQMETCLLVDAS